MGLEAAKHTQRNQEPGSLWAGLVVLTLSNWSSLWVVTFAYYEYDGRADTAGLFLRRLPLSFPSIPPGGITRSPASLITFPYISSASA